ncbi:MAG: hypothetical protein Q8N88_06425 [Nanoarchaeota archaeon]|nr:hypothetical protein [Nanoarchaeota archaeon]
MPDVKYKPLSIEEEIKKDKESSTPYILELKSKNKNLICFGIKHSSDFSEKQFEPLLQFIKKSDAILIETFDVKKEYDNEIKFILSKSENKQIIPCDINIIKAIILVAEKFDGKDVLVLRALAFLNKKERKIDIKKNILEIIDKIKSEEFFSEIYKKENLTEESFLQLFENYFIENNGKKIKDINVDDNIFPSPVENKTNLNKIIREVSYTRDVYMLKKLKETMSQFDNILYVLGKNHIIRQEEIIRQIFEKEK